MLTWLTVLYLVETSGVLQFVLVFSSIPFSVAYFTVHVPEMSVYNAQCTMTTVTLLIFSSSTINDHWSTC